MKNKVAIVVWDSAHAHDLQNQIDPDRKQFIVLPRLAPVRGLRLDKILVTDSFQRALYFAPDREKIRADEWLWLDLQSRLADTGTKLVFM